MEISKIYFERGTTIFSVLSPGHFWEHMSTKYGPLIKTIQAIKNQDSGNQISLLRDDFLTAIDPYIVENGIRLDYLLTIARK